jgi:hypothetical protein
LNGHALSIKRGRKLRFLREICPLKKMTPKPQNPKTPKPRALVYMQGFDKMKTFPELGVFLIINTFEALTKKYNN